MAFPASSEVDLILALHDAALGTTDWTPFLARVARLTGARLAGLTLRQQGFDPPVESFAAEPLGTALPETVVALEQVLGAHMRIERIYATPELRALAQADWRDGFDQALAGLGTAMAAIRVDAAPVTLTLGIFGAEEFDAADGAVLRRLFPFLQQAARTAAARRQERLRAETTARVAARSCMAWFLLDGAGLIVESWLGAPARVAGLLQRSPQPGSRIALASSSADTRLATLVRGMTADPQPGARALWVSRQPPIHLRLTRLPAVPDPRSSPCPALLATLHGQLVPPAASPGPLVDLLGLLPSESRLAAALAEGDSLAEAAQCLGLTLETARNYSKKIFAKTGARGQTDLVRQILGSGLAELPATPPAALAPESAARD